MKMKKMNKEEERRRMTRIIVEGVFARLFQFIHTVYPFISSLVEFQKKKGRYLTMILHKQERVTLSLEYFKFLLVLERK